MTGQTVRTSNRRSSTAYKTQESYMEGTAVRKMDMTYSQNESERRRRKKISADRKKSSNMKKRNSNTKRNRERATRLNRGFVIFLTVICVAVMFSAVYYLEIKSEVTTLIEDVAAKESELSRLKEENNTLQSELSSAVDLNAIKKEAMERLGMQYPLDEQNETYETSRGSFVRQYQDVPDK